jgi:hypothetical protein
VTSAPKRHQDRVAEANGALRERADDRSTRRRRAAAAAAAAGGLSSLVIARLGPPTPPVVTAFTPVSSSAVRGVAATGASGLDTGPGTAADRRTRP